MTLHWWMHWFWVTANVVVILANPLPSTTEEPKTRDKNLMISTDQHSSSTANRKLDDHSITELQQQENSRISKAIGIYPPLKTAEMVLNRQTTSPVDALINSRTKSKGLPESVTLGILEDKTSAFNDKGQVIKMPGTKKDSRISWILTTNKTSRSKYDEKMSENFRNLNTSEYESLTVLPLQEEVSRFKLVVNRSTPSSSREKTRIANASGDLVIKEVYTESQLIATAASILEAGFSESTRLSRARSAFTSDFQRDQKQEENPQFKNSDKSKNTADLDSKLNSDSTSVTDIAIIAGSCLASLALLSTIATVGFIMYRRRYSNPPQSLNSDKCSNPDSSGYIDDSTIRDNSEEMYSLDNDSFLNSLEAMTIQNYWTDSVKHTKL